MVRLFHLACCLAVVMTKLIDRNTTIPTKKDNNLLGKFQLEGIPPAQKRRLSQSEIDSEKITAKNGLMSYCYTMLNTLALELKEKIEEGNKEKIEAAVTETLNWLDKNQMAEKDEFVAQQKDLEHIVNPIMMKVYQK